MYTIEIDQKIHTLMHPVKSAGTSIHSAIVNASTNYDYKVHVNQRHANIKNLPLKYFNSPKYMVIREPHEWYKSFYRFFLGVDGYISFMLNDPKDDGYIYPISPDEFVRRSINFKDTLIKFPNKARVFRNLLRSQAHMHFITGYFENDFSPNDLESMEQFNCTLYDWFMRPMGMDCIFIPMNRLDVIEDIFKIEIPFINKTKDSKPDIEFSPEIIQMIKNNHSDWYDMYNNFNAADLKTIQEFKEERKKI